MRALTPDQNAALRAAQSASLLRVNDDYRPLCQMARQSFRAADIEALIAQGFLRWSVRRAGLVEITWRGRARLELTNNRAANAGRFEQLLSDLQLPGAR